MLAQIYDRIVQRMEALQLSARAASERAGLHSDTIRGISRAVKAGNRAGVSTRTLALLAPALGTTVTWLMDGDGDAVKSIGFGGALASGLTLVEWAGLAEYLALPWQQETGHSESANDWPKGMFGVEVVDGSMNKVSPLGSLIIVNRNQTSPVDGCYYLAAIGKAIVYRKWFAEPTRLEPVSSDDRFSVTYLPKRDSASFIGRVVRSMIEL